MRLFLHRFDRPVRIVWGLADRAFQPDPGRRLQQAFGDAEFVEVPDARTFVQLDAPEVLAEQITAAATSGDLSTSHGVAKVNNSPEVGAEVS